VAAPVLSRSMRAAINPAATTANLLRLLEANPGALELLAGKKAKALEAQGLRPFEVSGEHISALSERKFILLMRRLLSAKAQANGLPRADLHVASNLTAPDGGVDARIDWTGGPDRTDFLLGRACLFQLKASEVSPGAAAADVLTKSKKLEPAIQENLKAGGFYMMLCNRPYTYKLIEQREAAIRTAIRDQALTVTDEQVSFRDADQVATWVNAHPSVATWVLEQTQPGLGGPFRTWSHWAGRHEHERLPYIDDLRLPDLRDRLRGTLTDPRTVVRLVGLSGVGKSRLALEAMGPTNDEHAAEIALSDLILYAVEPDAGTTTVRAAVQTLVDLGVRVVVVVDRCAAETHQVLSGMVMRSSSKVSLLTIDHELPAHRSPETYVLEKASAEVTEGILRAVAPGLRSEDRRRLEHFVKGYPQLAVMTGEAWLADIPVATATDATLIDRVVIGRSDLAPERAVTVKAAMLVSALSLLGFREKVDAELDAAVPFSGGLAKDDLKAAIEDLRQRGVVQLRGRYATVEPKLIATALAERRWREWSPETWDKLLVGEGAPFSVRLAERLVLFNDTDIARKVVRRICRHGGPLDSDEAIRIESNAEVISILAQIDTRAVVDLLDRVLRPMSRDELREIAGSARRHVVRAVQAIAFVAGTFEEGANLMMELALAENESWGNNATGQFRSLFPVMLGETAADGEARLAMLDSAINVNDKQQLLLLVGALSAGAKTDYFSRMEGSESHGLRPAYEPWLPATVGEAAAYIESCLDRLLGLAMRSDAVGTKARQALAAEFRALTSRGFLDFVEKAVHDITTIHGRSWPAGMASLGDVLVYDLKGMSPVDEARIRALMALLSPTDFDSRIQLLVTEMPWDYPCDERLDFGAMQRRQHEAVGQLVDDLFKHPAELKKAMRRISVGQQRMAGAFGQALAERAANPLEWARPAWMALRRASEKERNGDLVAGYYVGLAAREPNAVASFKRAAVRSPIFARLVPYISLAIGITTADVELVCGGLESGILPVPSLHCWSIGGVLAKLPPDVVAPLFSNLLSGTPEAWNVAVHLMGMYAHSNLSRLDKLRPQVRLLAETSGVRAPRSDTMSNHHFGQVMTWMLKRGRDDEDARAVALSLTRSLVARAEAEGFVGDHRVTPLIPTLLKDYPDKVWALISKAIVADPKSAWRFQFALSERTVASGGKTSVLLNLHPDMLLAWCHAYPEVGPAFLSATIPLLNGIDEAGNSQLHPIVKRLLDEFGEQDDVQQAIVGNIFTFGWTGSTADYYRQYLAPLGGFARHPNAAVRRWVRKIVESLNKQIEIDKQHDDERDAFWGN
jgi:hypothetical protein